MPDSTNSFLQHATCPELEQAAAINHRELFVLDALAIGGEVRQEEGITWTGAGRDGQSMIAFPRLSGEETGPVLDRVLSFYLERRPDRLVGCWSLVPPQPPDLEVRLLARGFQLGWRPHWMALDLTKMIVEHPRPADLTTRLIGDEPAWDVRDLPYYSPAMAVRRQAAAKLKPRRLWRFGAFLDGKPVGHTTLVVTTGPLGTAGIYDVGVVEAARKKGIGKAVVLAACQHARAMGCGYAILNATGERMYAQIGFEHIGDGWTWWLNVPRLEARPPSPARIALTEAVGRGDREALDALEAPGDLDSPLPAGMTLLQLAVHENQPASVEWLLANGATLDVLSAWDLGWKERAPEILAERPELANIPRGEDGQTPLHVAVDRGDVELVRVILAADPDLSIEDSVFHSTALGWARHFQNTALVRLIEAQAAKKTERPQPDEQR